MVCLSQTAEFWQYLLLWVWWLFKNRGQIYEPYPPSRYSEHRLEYPSISFVFLRKFLLIRTLQVIKWFLNSLKYNSNAEKCMNCIFKLMNFYKWIDPCNHHPNQETTLWHLTPSLTNNYDVSLSSFCFVLNVTKWNHALGGFLAFVSQHHVW